MKRMRIAGFITAAIFLLFITACGGEKTPDPPNHIYNKTVSILITKTLSVHVGETKSLNVTRQNTDDFTVSVSPISGSGCEKSDINTVTCTPTTVGTYTVTVTATADTSKSSSATVTVAEDDPQTVSVSIAQSLSLNVGETGTLNVTRQNTDDFTVSVSPISGSGCEKSDVNTVTCTPTTVGTYTVTVTATADTSKSFSATVTVAEDEPTTPNNYTLQVEKFGEGTITGGGINCGDACEMTYEEGITVTLTAAAADDWEFRSWAGCDYESGTSCTVTINADKTLLPTFGRKALIYMPETVTLGESAISAFIKKDGTKYYFNSSAAQIGALQPGDVMLGNIGEELMRRVVSVEAVADQFVVETADASLEDVIQQGTISFSQQLMEDDLDEIITFASGVKISNQPDDIFRTLQTSNVTTMAGITPISKNIKISFCHEKVSGGFVICDERAQAAGSQEEIGKLEGSFKISARTDFAADYDFDWPPVKEVKLALISSVENNLSLKINGSFSGGKVLDIARLSFGPFPLVGPVTIKPVFVLKVGIEGSANGEITAGISLSVEATAGMHYKKESGWAPIGKITPTKNYKEPTVSAKASVKAYIRPEFSFVIAEIGGPSLRIEGYLRFNAKGKASPSGVELNFGLYAGTIGYIGGKVEIFGFTLAEYYAELWNKEWTLFEKKPLNDDPPGVPTGLKVVSISSSQTNVSWNEAANATEYKIFRAIAPQPRTFVESVTTLSYVDKGLVPLLRYCYQVSALNAVGDESARSEQVCVGTWPASDKEAPTVPRNLIATAVSSTQINLKWAESTDNVGVVGYGIFRGGMENPIKSVTSPSYSDTKLVASTQYCYRIAAYDTAGNASGKSAQVCTTTLAGTGGGDDPGGGTYTDPFAGEMILVQAGTFTMGCTAEQGSDCYSNESPAHQVTLTQDYYIGKYEVTQAQWKAVMGDNPSYVKGDDLPVEEVSWNDIQTFITRLNGMTGGNYRLPTEAEWEFAARGGNQRQGYKYSGSDNVGDVAWYYDNSGSKTHSVGTKKANELGIHDMSGNVLEWVNDWYGSYSSGAQIDPQGPVSGWDRVLRGGYWPGLARAARVSLRFNGDPDNRTDTIGFRLAHSSK